MKNFKITARLLARNSVLNLVGQVIPLLAGLITVPFIISYLGTERFGLLALAWVIIGYSNIFDLGLGRATTKFVSEALGKGEENRINELVWTAMTVQLAMGIIGLILLFIITPILVKHILNIPEELMFEAKMSFYLLSFSIPLVLVSGSMRGVLEASQRFDLVNAIKVPISTLTYVLPLICVVLGLNLPPIIGTILLARLLSLGAYLIINFRVLPGLSMHFLFSFKVFRHLFSFGAWITISNVIGPMLLYIDRFMIGALVTMSAVSHYSVPFDFICRVLIIPGSLLMALFPAFSAIGIERKEDLWKLFSRSIKYIMLSTVPIILFIWVFADEILMIWIGKEFSIQSANVLKVLLIGTLCGLLAPISNSLLQGLGRPDILPKMYLISFPIYILLLYISIRSMGLIGAALVASLRSLAETVILFSISRNLISLPYGFLVESGLFRSTIVLIALGISLGMTSFVNNFPLNVTLISLEILVFIVLLWAYILDVTDKRIFYQFLNRKLVATPPK